jgi:3-oxoadipate enol-lactonase
VARFRRRLVTTDAVGYVGCCEAVGKVDTTGAAGQIGVPTLVIAGELDQGTPVAMAQTLAEGIPGARWRC